MRAVGQSTRRGAHVLHRKHSQNINKIWFFSIYIYWKLIFLTERMCFLFLSLKGIYSHFTQKVLMYSQLKNYLISCESSMDNKSKPRMPYQQEILREEKAGNHFYIPCINNKPSHREEYTFKYFQSWYIYNDKNSHFHALVRHFKILLQAALRVAVSSS